MLQPNAANGSSDDENARRNAGKQASPDDRVMPAQDQQEGSGLGANPLKRFRRQAAFNGKTERPPGGTDAFAPGGGVTAPKETLRSSLVLPTDNLFSAPSPTVGSPTPEVVGDLAAGLKANLADLEFLLQSYRIDAEELLINRHLLTATSDMNMFFIQMDNIAKDIGLDDMRMLGGNASDILQKFQTDSRQLIDSLQADNADIAKRFRDYVDKVVIASGSNNVLVAGVKRDAARILQAHNSAVADLLQRFQKGMINLLADMLNMKNHLHMKSSSR